MDNDEVVVSDEARRRVDTARVRDFAFRIKKALPGFSDDEAEALAQVVIEASDQGIKATRPLVTRRLIEMGRSPDDAANISRALPES